MQVLSLPVGRLILRGFNFTFAPQFSGSYRAGHWHRSKPGANVARWGADGTD
jgi:hypothetical protein